MAEAIRAYMADPNYLKTVAPKTAAAIRKAVNADPEISKVIQFNSLAGVAAWAGLGGRIERIQNINRTKWLFTSTIDGV